jgi:hypothetical protein
MGMSEHKNPTNPYRRATAIAVTVLLLGLVASVAGNIQSILLDTPEGEAVSIGSMISAVWWPAILFLMIEIAIHTPWAKTGADRLAQWAGAGVIGALAFYISYFHLAHVLSSFNYDVVSRYMGPLAVDTAMMVATYALNRVGVAKAKMATELELAKADMARAAELATLATGMAKELASGGQAELAGEPAVATPEPVATVASIQEPSLADDWADLDTSWDEELAAMTAPASQPEPAEEPATALEPATAFLLTTVPTEAAKRIKEILAEDPRATGVAIAQALMDAGLASSSKTGRRYAAAVKNDTARLA